MKTTLYAVPAGYGSNAEGVLCWDVPVSARLAELIDWKRENHDSLRRMAAHARMLAAALLAAAEQYDECDSAFVFDYDDLALNGA
jgi:hypothetical protein